MKHTQRSGRLRWAVAMAFGLGMGQSFAQVPTALWEFDNLGTPLAATVGADLALVGSHSVASGIYVGDGAYAVGNGSHYNATHGMSANGGGSMVNQYTLLWDLYLPAASVGSWNSLHDSGSGDGDLFLRNASPARVGRGEPWVLQFKRSDRRHLVPDCLHGGSWQ